MRRRAFFNAGTIRGAAMGCAMLTALIGVPTAIPVHAANATVVASDEDEATDVSTAKDGGKKKDLPPKPTFEPEVEKELADFMTMATDAKRKLWAKKMDAAIEKIAKTTGLDDQSRKALEAPSRAVIETCMVEWKDSYDRMMRSSLQRFPDQVIQSIKEAIKNPDSMGAMLGFENSTMPPDHPDWTSALKRTLPPEKFSSWEKAAAEERQKVMAEIGDRVDGWMARSREFLEQTLSSKVDEMSRTLKLPKERVAQLQSLTKDAVEESLGKVREREIKMLAGMEAETRRQLLKNARVYLSPSEDEFPQNLTVWKSGLEKLLSADERKQLEAEASRRAVRSERTFGHLMVAEIDTRVALTADQRQRMEPVCEKLAAKNAALLSGSGQQGYMQLNVMEMLTAGLKAPDAGLKDILEPFQWQHWLDACDLSAATIRRSQRQVEARPVEDKQAVPAEPEELERVLADYLEEKTQLVRQKALAESLLRAEDAGRAASLPAEKIEYLKTAARGAVEDTMHNWKVSAEQTVRSFAANTPVRFLARRLEGLEDYNFDRRFNTPPALQPLWLNAFKAELNAEQLAAAEKSTNEREEFKNAAIATFIVAMFEQSSPLTGERETKMAASVAGAIKEYQEDIRGYFSGGGNTEWYLSSYSMFIPVAAVPEEELKSIVGPEGFEAWLKSPLCNNAMSYWGNLKQMHDAREKAKKRQQ